MSDLPTGTVTFLFTDIEGNTTHWEHHPEAMRIALACHDALLRAGSAERCGAGRADHHADARDQRGGHST